MSKRETVDSAVAAWYQDVSSTGDQFRGLSVVSHAVQIGDLIQKAGATTVLDYGSGLGWQYSVEKIHERWGVARPVCYDPGVGEFKEKPEGQFDFVVCSDVLEHVPRTYVQPVLEEIFEYAKLHVWLSVCCRPAKKWFDPETKKRNLHLTVEPPEWWKAKVSACATIPYTLIFTP